VKENGRKFAGQKKNSTHGTDEKTKIYYMGHTKFRDNFGALGRCGNFNK
jgi:hypothetical protein